MLESLLFIVALVACVGILTVVYKRQPLRALTTEKPSFVLFPKYQTRYQRSDADVELSILQQGFRPNELTGLFHRGTVRTGLTTKSIKLTVELDKENKEVKVYSSFFGILFDNGDIWQLTHDIIHGFEIQKARAQELADLFDQKH